jgi:hypothetical protein
MEVRSAKCEAGNRIVKWENLTSHLYFDPVLTSNFPHLVIMTLTETAIMTKKALLFGAVFSVVLIFAWAGYQYWYYQVYLPNLPVVEEVPDQKYGPLPPIALTQNQADSKAFNYKLDTDTGGLPDKIPKLYKVYSIAQLATDLLALDRAKSLAGLIGFNRGSQAISATQYKFLDQNGGELSINLDTGNFNMSRPISSESANLIESREQFQDPDHISSDFKTYLSGKNLLKDQLRDGRVKVLYDRSQGDPNKAIVNIWQSDVDETPIVTPTFSEGLVKGMVTNFRDEIKRYVYLDYTFWPIDLQNSSTYPIKTPAEAFTNLQEGKAMVPLSQAKTGSFVSITKVYLAYFLDSQFIPFLQPVYVFEGPEFVGYVPAIRDEALAK